MAALSGVIGVGIGWGRARERLEAESTERERLESDIKEKIAAEREERIKISASLVSLKEGGQSGGPVYMPRAECIAFREQCQTARCHEIAKLQELWAELASDTKALKNVVIWSLTNDKGMSLAEIMNVFETGDRRRKL